jgi:hypothetical protein
VSVARDNSLLRFRHSTPLGIHCLHEQSILLMKPSNANERLIIDSIIASLRNVNSISCGAQILGLLSSYRAILDPTGTTLPTDLDKGIFTRALWFFSAPRSDDEIERLLRTPCTCPPVKKYDPSHVTVDEQIRRWKWKSPVQMVLNRFLMHLSAAMQERPLRARKFLPHISRIGHLGVWPDTLEQILPHGPEDTIRGLAHWFKADIGDINRAILLQVIDRLYAYTSPKTIPHMVTTSALISHGVVPLLVLGGDATRSTSVMAERALDVCTSFFWSATIHRCDPTHRRILLQSHAVEILSLYDQAIQRLSHDQIELKGRDQTLEDRIQILVRSLKSFAGILVQELFWWTNGKVAYKALAIDTLPHLHSFWQRTLNAIEYSSEGQCCGLPDCMQTFLDTDSFRLCSGCRRVTYCSRRCQIRAWTHPAVPHREVCGKIHQVCTESGIPRIRMKVLKDRKPEVFNEVLGQAITEHFEAATRYRTTKFSSTYSCCLTSCDPADTLIQSYTDRKASGSETCCVDSRFCQPNRES